MSVAEFSTRRRVSVAMVTVTMVLFGLIALGDLKVNLLPDLSYPTLTVRTEYTGAAPTEVENLITEPAEEDLVARRTPGRLDGDPACVLEARQVVKATAADDA